MTIPGVAKLTPRVVTLGVSSIQVVALHVKLLDGSGTLLDLGQARVHVARSGL